MKRKEHNGKTEEQMRAEGRQISRAIDNYEPLKNTSAQAKPQKTLDEVEK